MGDGVRGHGVGHRVASMAITALGAIATAAATRRSAGVRLRPQNDDLDGRYARARRRRHID